MLKNKKLACAAILLALLAATGIAYAAYTFLTATTEITIEEVIILSLMDPVNDLQPYMVDNSPIPSITVTSTDWGAIITITEDPGRDASEFCPGEKLVIPINVRSRSRGATAIPVTVSISGDPGLRWCWAYETNTVGSTFKPAGWVGTWPATFGVTDGQFSSATSGANVFFVYIEVPMDAVPATYYFTVTFSRG